MSWFNVWDGLKNKTCRYLLQRYLGQFLEEKLNLEQLNVELYSGKATIRNVSINLKALNDLCETHGWCIEVVAGHIGLVEVTVPWNALMTSDTLIEFTDVCISLRPAQRRNGSSSMLESMWSSVSSSLQLAQDYLQSHATESEDMHMENQNNPIEGLEKFAQTIDNVLNRIKAKCFNSVIRLEHIPPGSTKGIAIILKVRLLSYKNETANEISAKETCHHPGGKELNVEEKSHERHFLTALATHSVTLENIMFCTEEIMLTNFGLSDTHKNYRNTIKDDNQCCGHTAHAQGARAHETCPKNIKLITGTSDILPFNQTISSSHFLEDRDNSGRDNEKEPRIKIRSKSIPFAKIDGAQKILIKTKQNQEASGPKVLLDFEFGPIYLFLTPRQLHLVLHFTNSFFVNSFQSNIDLYREDQKLLESSVHSSTPSKHLYMTGLLDKNSSWAGVLEEDNTLSNKRNVSVERSRKSGENNDIYGFKDISAYNSESLNSSVNSSRITSNSFFQPRTPRLKSSGDISSFDVRATSLYAILLHEDVLFESGVANNYDIPNNQYLNPLTSESENNLLKICDQFFSLTKTTPNEVNNFQCKKNHIKLQIGAISSCGNQRRNDDNILTKLNISVSTFDLQEVLDETPKNLLLFDLKEENDTTISIDLIVTAPSGSEDKSKNLTLARNECKIELECCEIEFDISIYDRLNALFSNSPFEMCTHGSPVEKDYIVSKNKYEAKDPVYGLSITSSKVELKLRFPIADNRPIQDPHRIPWWKQNIRSDFLVFSFSGMQFKWNVSAIEITADIIDVFYSENTILPRIQLIKARCMKLSDQCLTPRVKYPKIVIEKQSKEMLTSSIKCYSDRTEMASDETKMHLRKNSQSLPFSSRRECRQSDTCHSKQNGGEESETILLPGESKEIRMFCNRMMKTSKIKIKCSLPETFIQINSKQLYEIIYNRLNSDLFMWEPSSPKFSPVTENRPLSVETNACSTTSSTSFKVDGDMFNIKISNDYDSYACGTGGNPDSPELESMYFSTCQKNKKRTHELSTPLKMHPNFCSLELFVGKGIFTIFPPVRDCENRVLPGQSSAFSSEVDSLDIFYVSGFNENNKHVSYICLQSKLIEVYHCALVPYWNLLSCSRIFNVTIPNYMHDLIYPTPLDKKKAPKYTKREMLSTVIEINKSPEDLIKRLKITTGIQRATLRHKPALSPHAWLNQIVDFLDIMEYPIEGYNEYRIVTEAQLHFWDCAIDYRPKHFQYCGMMELSSFVISSNIVSFEPGCALRFVVEDCMFSLAPDVNGNEETKLSSSRLNFVSVLDVGLLDISLRLNDKATEKCSKLDLRTSIHDVHIRTCSDSARALAQLIGYIANDGDLKTEAEHDQTIISSVESAIISKTELFPVNERHDSALHLTSLQQERINTLLAEAVEENITSSEQLEKNMLYCDERLHEDGVNMFLFPDESCHKITEETIDLKTCSDECGSINDNICTSKSFNDYKDVINHRSSDKQIFGSSLLTKSSENYAVKTELGDMRRKGMKPKSRSSDLTNSFRIISEEYHNDTQSDINDMAARELDIIDNHFCQPTNTPDLLKCPEDFPIAEKRYTLCEITLTWHLYGGRDFPNNTDFVKSDDSYKTTEKTVSASSRIQMSRAYNDGVSSSKNIGNSQCGKKSKEKLSKKIIGGINRNHEILVEVQFTKVRFSHEEYPVYSAQASRQVLIINEFEIRDRLLTSDINKFLYHPRSRQLHCNKSKHMVVLKALHLRPNFLRSSMKECILRISVLPLRLNIDQETLLFLTNFFSECTDFTVLNKSNYNTQKNDVASRSSHELPGPLLLVDEVSETKRAPSRNNDTTAFVSTKESETLIYFREVIFSPEVQIRIDYHGHRVEMSRGPIAGLLMGLGQLQCSEIRLRKIIFKHGILGVENLVKFLCKEWLNDIKKHQLPAILSGVGPTYAFVQLFQGLYDLFWLPIEQYQKDGRIIRGLQLGAQSFTARTALAALEIASRLIFLMQLTAETAFDMLSPGPSVRSCHFNGKGNKKRPCHPKNIVEGVTNAYFIVKEGINDSASTLITAAAAEHDQKGYTGAVGAVMRQIPQLVLRPAVLATQAGTNIVGGAKISLEPDAKIEALAKWKQESD